VKSIVNNTLKIINKSSSSHYLIAVFFQKGIVFLTIPIFTRLLNVQEYGMLTIFQSLINILIVFTTLGARGAILRYYHDEKTNFKTFYISIVSFFILYNIAFVFIVYLLKNDLSYFLSIPSKLLFFSTIIAVFSAFTWFYLSYLQASSNSKQYAVLSIINTVIVVLLAIFWIDRLADNKYYGRVYAQFVINGILLFYVIFKISRFSSFQIDIKQLKKALKFSIPLVPHILAGFLLSFFDRIIINQIVDSKATGIYSLAYNIGMIVHVLVMALNKAWSPFFYKALNNAEYDTIIKKAKKYMKYVVLSAIVTIFLSPEILHFFAPNDYQEGLILIPVISFSYILVYLYITYSSYAYYKKKTGLISFITIIAVFLNIVLNYIFIPKYGYQIAALTTLLSYFILFILHYINTKFILKIKNIIKFKILIPYLIIAFIAGILISYSSINNYHGLIYSLSRYTILILLTFLLLKKEIMQFINRLNQ